MYESIYRFIDRASVLVMRTGGALILLSAVMVSADVLSRMLFGTSIAGLDEISGYMFGVATAAAFSACLIRRCNVRIDGLYRLMPTRIKIAVDFLAIVALTAFLGMVTWVSSDLVMSSYTNWSRSISPLQTPLFIPQVIWISFLGLAVVTGVVIIGLAVNSLYKKQWTQVRSLIGPLSYDEEIEIGTENLDTNAYPAASVQTGNTGN